MNTLSFARLFLAAALFAAPLSAVPKPQEPQSQPASADPWTPQQTVQAIDLVREINEPIGHPPQVVYVGVHTLFKGGHIPGATFIGTGSTEEGIAHIKKWAADMPRISNIVLYCGCCPMDKCPNIRPAFNALKELGFTNIRVLILPDSFSTDWVAKGYPTAKGK